MRTIHFLLGFILAIAALTQPITVHADDTDIYLDPGSSEGSEPLVMFSLDYRSNLTNSVCSNINSSCTAATYLAQELYAGSLTDLIAGENLGTKLTTFDLLRLALKVVFNRVGDVDLKIGLMMSHNHENNCVGPTAEISNKPCSNGGVILLGFEDIVTGGPKLLGKLDKLKTLKPLSNSPDHSYQGAELFFEFFRYLTGQGIFNGHNGGVDFESGNSTNRNTNMDCNNANCSNPPTPTASWDKLIESGSSYLSPLATAASCAKVYTINFLFQVANQESDSLTAMNAAKASGGFGITVPSNDPFTPTIEYLNEVDLANGTYGALGVKEGVQNVTSYFFVGSASHLNNTTNGYAAAGGTGSAFAFGDDPAALVANLENVFRSILSISTTFVAASVPVNVFNRAQLVDNVYIALFQAEEEPIWNGNVKKLKLREITLADNSKKIELVDASTPSPLPAVADDGRIKFDALTYWTNPTPLTDSDASENIVAGKDGRHVNRGGAGQKIPGFLATGPGDTNAIGPRKVFYDKAGITNPNPALVPLNATDTVATDLNSVLGAVDGTDTGTDNNAETLELLKYMRGQDTQDADADAATNTAGLTESRPWLFGDPLHSRPLPINYGDAFGYSTANPAIFIAVGSNDGYLRLLRNTTTGGDESGEELFAFMPQAVMGIQKKLKANIPLAFPEAIHPIGFDGPTAAFVQDNDGDGKIEPGGTAPTGGDTVHLIAGLRRGGRAYFGIDISDPTGTPESFKFWRVDNNTTGFDEMGLSFSQPQTGYVKVGSTRIPVVIFTAGYDTNKDYSKDPDVTDKSEIGSNDTKGRAIYVVNAATGALVWSVVPGSTTTSVSDTVFTHAKLKDSIPSDVAAVDTDGDGLLDRILVGDTGGRVWRADMTADGVRANWEMYLLADLGRHHVTGSKSHDRRFFHAPDIALSKDSVGQFYAVVIGSGDREDPQDKSGLTDNYFFVIKDRNLGIGSPTGDSTATFSSLADLTSSVCGASDATCNTAFANGYRFRLQEGQGTTREKSLAAPVTLNNVVFFTTYVPAGGTQEETCGPNEGTGFLYAVNLKDGTAALNYDVSDNVVGSVGDKNKKLSSGGIPAQIVLIPAPSGGGIVAIAPDLSTFKPPGSTRLRSYWQHVDPQ